jgi:hypothetical protein
MRELGDYWSTRCSEYAQSKLFDERFFNYLKVGITLPPMKSRDEFRGAYAGSGLCLSFNFTDCYTDFARWMKGLNPLIEEIKGELSNLRFFSQEAVNKKLFLTASLIVLNAIIRLAERYAEAAKEWPTQKQTLYAEKTWNVLPRPAAGFRPILRKIFIRPCSPYGSTRSSQRQAQHIISAGLISICTPFIKRTGMMGKSLMKRCLPFCVNCV